MSCSELRPVAVGSPRHALDLAGGKSEHLAELADRAPRAEGREGRHQRRMVVSKRSCTRGISALADVAGEVQVDVGQPVQVLVQEAPQREPAGDGIDVREAGQVADQ